MAKNTFEAIAVKIAKICIEAVEKSKQFSVLQEMHGFDGITNFAQTIKDLIFLDQMHIFGISKEMQVILKHINQLSMLSHISMVRNCFQKEYEKLQSRTVVVVSIGKEDSSDIGEVVASLRQNFNEGHDFIFKKSNTAGILIRYKDKILEYTPETIAKMLKVS